VASRPVLLLDGDSLELSPRLTARLQDNQVARSHFRCAGRRERVVSFELPAVDAARLARGALHGLAARHCGTCWRRGCLPGCRARCCGGCWRRCPAADRLRRRAPRRRAGGNHQGERARPTRDPAPLKGGPRRQRRHRGHPVRRHRTLPGAGATTAAAGGQDHGGRGVPAHLGAANSEPAGRRPPSPVVGTRAIDASTWRGSSSRDGGFRPRRGRRSQSQARCAHHRHLPRRPPDRLKQHGRHMSYAVLDEYRELGDPFDGHPLSGVM